MPSPPGKTAVSVYMSHERRLELDKALRRRFKNRAFSKNINAALDLVVTHTVIEALPDGCWFVEEVDDRIAQLDAFKEKYPDVWNRDPARIKMQDHYNTLQQVVLLQEALGVRDKK